jgi:uncharacterized protein YcbK (DUF882 family)
MWFNFQRSVHPHVAGRGGPRWPDHLKENVPVPEENTSLSSSLNRRAFLGVGLTAAAALLVPERVAAALEAPVRRRSAERELALFNIHTGERLTTTYCCDGEYQPAALQQIDFILRDFRANQIKPIDPALLDLLSELQGTLGCDSPYHVISGYRSPETNAMLRVRGGANSGVASGSMHVLGKAIDIRVPGVKLADLREAARSLKLGGVGFYPASNFVHVDTGRVRYW